jgi:NAD(P)-dependent dehydrogenase (short-subunit alcohol dehydrogenase family)
MDRDLSGKITLVVGGAAGIGRAAARICAERGARVVIADRDEQAGASAAGEIGAHFLPVDVTEEASVRGLFSALDATHGRLDVLLHTAGILKGAYVPLAELTLQTFRAVLDVNTTGSFLCAKYAAPLMRRGGKGVIVLVSSGAATGGSSSFAYGTSKGGVNSLGIVLANALAADNIRVNVVAPGNVDTAMKRSVIQADLARQGRPQELEQAVSAAALGDPAGVGRVLAWLASDEADYVRGLIATR